MNDDATLEQLELSLVRARIHFYQALQAARNIHHADNREALSSRLERVHEVLQEISDFAKSRKAAAA
jgi:hypothetical protein